MQCASTIIGGGWSVVNSLLGILGVTAKIKLHKSYMPIYIHIFLFVLGIANLF